MISNIIVSRENTFLWRIRPERDKITLKFEQRKHTGEKYIFRIGTTPSAPGQSIPHRLGIDPVEERLSWGLLHKTFTGEKLRLF